MLDRCFPPILAAAEGLEEARHVVEVEVAVAWDHTNPPHPHQPC